MVVYWWWNHNLCVRYVYLLKAGLNMEINRKMGGIIRMCEQVAASGNTLILYSA